MGPSGFGKSTLMHCAAGLDTLTPGAAHIGDTDLSTPDDRRLTLLRRDRVGFVFPGVQPGADVDGRGEHHAASGPRGRQRRPRVDRRADRLLRAVGQTRSQLRAMSAGSRPRSPRSARSAGSPSAPSSAGSW
nr:ATP-binding cassette domain-containing protein [Streptomyces dysideae]